MTKHEELAHELHRQGYSCAQAVAVAFSDLAGLDRATLLKLTAGFGGGIADLREICGAVSGAMMALDLIYAEGAPNKQARSQNDYPRLQALAGNFKALNGSIICRELLGVDGAARTRPAGKTCHDMVCDAARLVDEYIEAHPIPATGGETR